MKRYFLPAFVSLVGLFMAHAAIAQQNSLAAQGNARIFNGQVGRHITFVCAGDVSVKTDSNPIYGTGVYSDTSPVCTAAAHEGLFTPGKSAVVTIVMGAAVPSLQGSARNAVTSLSYGNWDSTYTFSNDGQPGQIEWNTTLDLVAADYLQPITVVCPPKGQTAGEVWGTDVYSNSSAVCAAALHTGAITAAGGPVTVTRVPKQASFPSTTRNGITSQSWGDPAWASYPQPYRVAQAMLVNASNSGPGAPSSTVPVTVNLTTTGTITPAPGGTATPVTVNLTTTGTITSGSMVNLTTTGSITPVAGGTATPVTVNLTTTGSIAPGAGGATSISASPGGVIPVVVIPAGAISPSGTLISADVPASPGAIATGPVTLPGTGTRTATTQPSGTSQTSPFVNTPTIFNSGTSSGSTATGTANTGTIITPGSASGTTSTPTSAVLVSPTATPTATGSLSPAATTSGSATSGPGSTANTMTNASFSNLPPNAGHYRVSILGLTVQSETRDNPTQLDGRGDEIYAAAVALHWDRQQNQLRSRTMAQTVEYGDIGVPTKAPSRLQAGTASVQGGIIRGSTVPNGFDPKSQMPAPMSDRFPLLVWDGVLTDAVDGLLIVPSIWERDSALTAFNTYKAMWLNATVDKTLTSPFVTIQLPTPGLTSVVADIQPGLPTLITLTDLVAQVIDRPIGLTPTPLIEPYHDRFVVVTREKLASLAVGSNTTMAIPYQEPDADPILGGTYTLHLRVERLQ